ncbi:MAG: hypothetical protein GY760_18645 [Deltaproteobacteria bacterium]|nr:hypothetical protein [Deltaproteobacteria bacterium]
MKVINEQIIQFKDVVPDTEEEKAEIEKIIQDVNENDVFEPEKMVRIDNRKKKKESS